MKKVLFAVMAMIAIGFASCGNKAQAPADAAEEVNVDSIASAAAEEGLAVLGSQLEIKDADKIQAAIDALRAKVAELDPETAKVYVAKVQDFLKENADKIKEAVGENAAVTTALAAFTELDPEDAVNGILQQAGDAAADAKDAAAEAVDNAKQAAEDKANEVKDAAKDKANEAIDAAAEKAKKGLGI